MSNTIICILGESGAGKTTLQSAIMEKTGIRPIISTTSRPMRSTENGDEYKFISEDEFKEKLENNEFVEHATYNGWKYGLTVDELIKGGIAVVTPHGLRTIVNWLKMFDLDNEFKFYSIYLKVDRKSRLIKLIETRDDIEECYRRNLTDIGFFEGIEDEVSYVLNNSEYRMSVDTLADQTIANLGLDGF